MKELIIIFVLLIVLLVLISILVNRYNDNMRYVRDFEFRDIEYNCLLINEMWNKMTDEEREKFWGGTPITSIPINSPTNIDDIKKLPSWYF